MTLQVRNVNNIAVGTSTPTTPSAGIYPGSLADGEVGIFTEEGLHIRAAAITGVAVAAVANMKYVIGVGGPVSGTPFFVSDVIDPKKGATVGVTSAYLDGDKLINSKAGTAATEQHDTIGFDGTSGSLEAINSNLYLGQLYIQEMLTSSTDGRLIKHFQYKSDATATQAEVSNGLVKSAINNFSKEAEDYIGFKNLINNAGAIISVTGGATVTFTKGSKTVTTAAVNQSFTNPVVGDYIGAQAPATLTGAMYKVVGKTAGTATTKGTLTLDYAFQEATISPALAATKRIAAAVADAADTGIDILGKPLAFSLGKFFYSKARWVMNLKDFGTSTSANVASATKGIGTYEEVTEQQWFMAGFEGESYRMGEPAIHNFVGTTVSGLLYDITNIRWVEDSTVGFQANVSPKQLTIATPDDLAAADYMRGAQGVWIALNTIHGLSGTLAV